MVLLHFVSDDGHSGEEYVVFVNDDSYPDDDYRRPGFRLYRRGKIRGDNVLDTLAHGDIYERRL